MTDILKHYLPNERKPTPVSRPRLIVKDSEDPGYTAQLLIGTACTGLLRVEWYAARTNQIIPLNWSLSTYLQVMGGVLPLRHQVADAQNLIVAEAIKLDVEWLFLLEHDVIIPQDCLVQLNRYMKSEKTPVVSGLYFSRAYPSEPMVFRGMGMGAYTDFKIGDKVWCDGVPTGCLLIHMSLLKEMWKDSEEYFIKGEKTRKVFDTPRYSWQNPETGFVNMSVGTSDLEWCKKVIQGDYLRRAGWYDMVDYEYPFLVDTGIFCRHCNPDGTMFPDSKTLGEYTDEQ